MSQDVRVWCFAGGPRSLARNKLEPDDDACQYFTLELTPCVWPDCEAAPLLPCRFAFPDTSPLLLPCRPPFCGEPLLPSRPDWRGFLPSEVRRGESHPVTRNGRRHGGAHNKNMQITHRPFLLHKRPHGHRPADVSLRGWKDAEGIRDYRDQ